MCDYPFNAGVSKKNLIFHNMLNEWLVDIWKKNIFLWIRVIAGISVFIDTQYNKNYTFRNITVNNTPNFNVINISD